MHSKIERKGRQNGERRKTELFDLVEMTGRPYGQAECKTRPIPLELVLTMTLMDKLRYHINL